MGEVIPFSRQIAREAGGWGFVMPIPADPAVAFEVGIVAQVLCGGGEAQIHARNVAACAALMAGRCARVDPIPGTDEWVLVAAESETTNGKRE